LVEVAPAIQTSVCGNNVNVAAAFTGAGCNGEQTQSTGNDGGGDGEESSGGTPGGSGSGGDSAVPPNDDNGGGGDVASGATGSDTSSAVFTPRAVLASTAVPLVRSFSATGTSSGATALAFTGASISSLVLLGALLVMAGLLLLRRRARATLA